MRQKDKSISNSIKLPKFGRKSKILDPRKSANPENKIQNKTRPGHMIVKLLKSKDKKKILKAVREIHIYRGRHYIQGEIMSLMDDILSKTKETNQQQNDIFQVQKENPKVNTGFYI